MIAGCQKAELPEPEFFQEGDQFVLRIWRDWLTADFVAGLDINDRQRKALAHLKQVREIGNSEYQSLVGASKRTAHRDLTDLVNKNVLERIGTTGRGTAYVIRKRAAKGPNGPSGAGVGKGATKGPKGPSLPT